jgi:DNA polymerase-3 subunit delta'
LIEAGNHPDLRILQTEEDRKSIVIEQVRELIDFYALKPHYGTRKVTIIYPVELLNHNATNALLKVLEEPPSGALLLLVSHRPGQLIATLSSRCQKIVLHEPDWASCSAWLEQRRQADASLRPLSETTLFGAPLDLHEQLASTSGLSFDHVIETLAALAREHRAVLARAKEFSDVDIRRFLDTIDLVIRAAVLLRFGHQLQRLHVAAAGGEQLQEIANKLNSKRLFFFLDQIASARLAVLRSSGVRGTEVIENLFYCWANITQAEAKV